MLRRRRSLAVTVSLLLVAGTARAQEPPPAEPPPETPREPNAGDAEPPKPEPPKEDAASGAVAAAPPEPKDDPAPPPAESPPQAIKFTADPIADGATLALGATFGFLSSAVIATDEIRPQQISPTFSTNQLLGIDRFAVTQTIDHAADTRSNVGFGVIVGYAVVDTVADGFRFGKSAALVDGIMYAEAFLVTQGLTNVAKIAFRRPRPRAYIARNEYLARGGDPTTYDNSSADSSLSFFSGHASQAAALAAASTYIAFSRSPGTVRPWLTLGAGLALTSFVSYERVRSGAHFPTDVIAGAIIGSGVGALVVHVHRENAAKQRPVWIGIVPVTEGAILSASGLLF